MPTKRICIFYPLHTYRPANNTFQDLAAIDVAASLGMVWGGVVWCCNLPPPSTVWARQQKKVSGNKNVSQSLSSNGKPEFLSLIDRRDWGRGA